MPSAPLPNRCDASMEDMDIVSAYRAHRHATCFRLLYDRYTGMVYSKAITMLHDSAEAEDATQEIFAKVFLNLGKFQGQSKFSTWVYSITYNLCIDKIRKSKRGRDLFAPEITDPPDMVEEVSDQELFRLQVSELRYVLSQLSQSERTLLLMKYKDGVKIRVIAELLGKGESAIKMQIKRAKEKAKRVHQQRQLTPETR